MLAFVFVWQCVCVWNALWNVDSECEIYVAQEKKKSLMFGQPMLCSL